MTVARRLDVYALTNSVLLQHKPSVKIGVTHEPEENDSVVDLARSKVDRVWNRLSVKILKNQTDLGLPFTVVVDCRLNRPSPNSG